MRQKSAPKTTAVAPPRSERWILVFAAMFGALLGLSLIKFGNPAIFDDLVTQPSKDLAALDPGFAANPAVLNPKQVTTDFSEVLYRPWSMKVGLGILSIIVIVGVSVGRWKPTGHQWLMLLPLAWLLWVYISAISTVNVNLTKLTLLHFTAVVVCFYVAWFALAQTELIVWFWGFLLIGMVLVLWNGLGQHYGGLEALRKFIYEQPDWKQFSPSFLRRVASGRIYASMFYPNALAAAILMLLPPLFVTLWQLTQRLPTIARGVLVGLLLYLSLACLIWSGSKAGWLIALVLGLVALLQFRLKLKVKRAIVASIMVIGLAAFFARYSGYFEHGAPSVGARFDYWQAALTTTLQHPLLGSGPGTFGTMYKKIKDTRSEMARLAHNDYLEQASDSGVPAFIAFSGFIIGSLTLLYRSRKVRSDPLRFAAWLGLLGFFLQSLVEFGIYIPALAWTSFSIMGWLWGGIGDAGVKTMPLIRPQLPQPESRLAKGGEKAGATLGGRVR